MHSVLVQKYVTTFQKRRSILGRRFNELLRSTLNTKSKGEMKFNSLLVENPRENLRETLYEILYEIRLTVSALMGFR